MSSNDNLIHLIVPSDRVSFSKVKKRKYYENHLDEVVNILEKGTEEARKRASRTLEKVKSSMKINYFKNDDFLNEAIDKYK